MVVTKAMSASFDVRNKTNSLSAASPFRVLLAEDNKINQQFATLILRKAGHSVQVAANGREAFDLFCASTFDIVLMDIQMPVLDGVQAARLIRGLPAPKGGVPIVALTAHAMAGAREQYLTAGMDGYISKPYKPALLLETVAQICCDEKNGPPPLADEVWKPSGDADVDGLPVLDLEQLRMFESVFSAAKIQTLATLYIVDVEARLMLIAESRALEDFEGISRQAHIIVSTAGNLGAKQASALARNLEVSCLHRDQGLCDRQIAELRNACLDSSRAIKEWQESEASAGKRSERFMPLLAAASQRQ